MTPISPAGAGQVLPPDLQPGYDRLAALIAGCGRVVVAFSGGVDSSLLLKVALDTLGPERVLAVIAQSESYPARELAEALLLAGDLGTTPRVIASAEFSDPRYRANPANRCYYCKSELFGRLAAIAREEGYAAVLEGNNADDAGDYRPGRQAAQELGVRSPLLEVGLGKAEVRALARALGLPNWDKPAAACLASRIPYGTPLTPETLSRVDAAEQALLDLGFRQVRVRHHGDLARIEVAPAEVDRLLAADVRREVTARLRRLGYRYVSADLQGYRTGSANEALSGA